MTRASERLRPGPQSPSEFVDLVRALEHARARLEAVLGGIRNRESTPPPGSESRTRSGLFRQGEAAHARVLVVGEGSARRLRVGELLAEGVDVDWAVDPSEACLRIEWDAPRVVLVEDGDGFGLARRIVGACAGYKTQIVLVANDAVPSDVQRSCAAIVRGSCDRDEVVAVVRSLASCGPR